MELERISPHLGVRVTGIDLSQVTAADAEELNALVDKYLVVFFAEQTLEPRDFLRFGETLGELEPPEIGAPQQPTLEGDLDRVNYLEVDERIPRGGFADIWHADGSYFERPSHGALLQPTILPTVGGDTLWTSTYAAYDALSDSVRRSLEDLSALHSAGSLAEFVHPIVRVNPSTGRRGLFVNRLFAKLVVGLSEAESRNLLELLFNHLSSPDFQIRFRWTTDIVAVWDNRFAQHFAVRDYSERRRMLRLALAGEKPIGPNEFHPRG
ncbi:TauD/TfdA family dioxygenase [Myxococcota bacterium]|nr:TauD/TfdA family dioxygenase [Myxococcota bacterium]